MYVCIHTHTPACTDASWHACPHDVLCHAAGATICCIMLLAGASALLVGFSLGLRYVLAYLTCCFCKPLPPASWVDQVMLLHPLPPGSLRLCLVSRVLRSCMRHRVSILHHCHGGA